jgi:hypothetical protein
MPIMGASSCEQMQGQPLTLCCLGLEKLTSDLGFEPSPFCCWRGYLVCYEVACSHKRFFFFLQFPNFAEKSLMGSGFVQADRLFLRLRIQPGEVGDELHFFRIQVG